MPGGLLPVASFQVLVMRSTPQSPAPKLQELATTASTPSCGLSGQWSFRTWPHRLLVSFKLPSAGISPTAIACEMA
eukprot:3924610-Rhodomonas_salina.1